MRRTSSGRSICLHSSEDGRCTQIIANSKIGDFQRVEQKSFHTLKNLRFSSWSYDAEMCRAILWVIKQDDSTTPQSIYSMHRWPPLQGRRNEFCWRIVTSLLSVCFKNVYTWHELEDLILYGPWTNLHDKSRNGPKLATRRNRKRILFGCSLDAQDKQRTQYLLTLK